MTRSLATLCFLVTAIPLAAAVDGTVMNRTTGKPQPGATVTLYKLGQAGMESLESVKSDEQGKFRINQTPQGPHLIQTAYDGVTYNKMLPPGTPATGLDVEVYNSSRQPGGAKVAQHMILFEPGGSEMTVNESLIYRNDGKTTYNDPEGGTLRFHLADGAGKVRVTASAPQGMPVERAAEKSSTAGVYKVDFPIKPGETRFDLIYALPFKSPGTFSGRLLHKEGPTRLVTPRGVTLKGAAIESLGQEPTTQASIYSVKGAEYSVEIEGTGSLRAAEGGGEEDSSPRIEQIQARIYDRIYVILGLALAILAAGFVLHYRARTAQPKGPRD